MIKFKKKSPNNPYQSTDYDTQFLHPYLLNINYGRNGFWTKHTMAEPECGRNVSKALTQLLLLEVNLIKNIKQSGHLPGA
jgi:hypothetical protein